MAIVAANKGGLQIISVKRLNNKYINMIFEQSITTNID